VSAQTSTSPAPVNSTIPNPLNAFQGTIAPSALSWMYRAGLGAVAFAMVLLPAVYVALIALVGWGVYWHATNNTGWLTSGSGKSGVGYVIAYAGPIVAGVIIVLFMVKPFFAKRGKRPLTISLQRQAEPLLFQFVDRVCALVGAPAPAQIEVNCDVNASAGFRKGLASFLGNDLVLTIGLPLVAGLNMRQFGGVLAHEFGHFAQGAGMRLTYVIRQVNHWFARVVYERDQWDVWLAQTAKSIDFRVGIVLHAARGAVWLTRKILWALMHVGNAISCFMLRQMEFDADSYECKLAGTDTFADTTARIQTLGIASQHAFGDLSESWRSGRLPDNFAAFVQHKAASFPPELRGKIQEEFGKRKTGAFDTHPADGDRIKAAQALNAPGVFRLEDPATALFADFADLSKSVTRAFYEKEHELALTDQSLVSTEESVKESLENENLQRTLQRYYCGVNMAVVPFQVGRGVPAVPPADWRVSLRELEAARAKCNELKDAVAAAHEKHGEVEASWIKHYNVCSLRQANFTIDAKDFEVASTHIPDLERTLDTALQELREIESKMQPFSEAAAARIAAALQLLNHEALPLEVGRGVPAEPPFASLQPLKAESVAVLEVLSGLSDVLRNVHALRRRFPGFELLLQNRGNHQEPAKVDAVISPLTKALKADLDAIHARLKDVRYPFPHASGQISVSQYARRNATYEHDIEEVYTEGHSAMDRLYSLFYKTAGRIASIAELIEERAAEINQTAARPGEPDRTHPADQPPKMA
jgi:Zn-dependent protease with chaperone function